MKFLKLLLVSLLITTGFSACKKAQVEEPELTGCAKHAIVAPKITLNGIDSAGKAMELSMDSTAADTGLTYFWQLPNGSVSKGRIYKINEIEKVNRGTYYGYYITNDSCTSYKNPVTLKADGFSSIPLPCDLPYNYLGLPPSSGTRIENMLPGYARKVDGHIELEFYNKPSTRRYEVYVDLNVPELQEGVYTMTQSKPGFGEINGKYAWFSISNAWINIDGDKLYIVKNKGKFELIICGAKMIPIGSGTVKYPLDAHLMIE